MKNISKYLLLFVAILFVYSCKEELEVYSSETNRIGFSFPEDADSLTKYSFVYYPQEVDEKTIWIELSTVGFVSDQDRTIKIVQVPTGDDRLQCVAGKHYVPFDDPSIAKHFVVPAGSNKALVPIVFKRDPSLKDGKYYIKLRVEKNDFFDLSYSTDNEKVIEVSDVISRPRYWEEDGRGQAEFYFAGEYGEEKYRFMISVATWTIDEDWFEINFKNSDVVDMGYGVYMSEYFCEKLRERNKREGNLLREKSVDGVEGELVQFVERSIPQPVE